MMPSLFKYYNPASTKLKQLVEMKDTLPKEAADILDDVDYLTEARDSYCCKMTSDRSATVSKMEAEAWKSEWGVMTTNQQEGQFLKTAVSMANAKRILEVGLFFGHSALSMAEALPSVGVVISCEINAEQVTKTQKLLDMSPHGKKVLIKQGPAKDTLLELANQEQKFDFIFVDADKESQVEYYKIIFSKQLLAPRGTLVFDNSFFFGETYDMRGTYPNYDMRKFNEFALKDDNVHRVLVPIRDGMLFVRRREDVEGSN